VSGWIVLAIFVALVLVTVLIWVVVIRISRKLSQDLAAWAAERGWGFEERDTTGLLDRIGGIPAVGSPRSGTVSKVLRGAQRGRQMQIFEYLSTSGASAEPSGRAVHMFTGFVAELAVAVPELSVGRRRRIRGHHHIELGSEEFDSTFTVTCDVPAFATELLTTPVQQLLLQRPKQWSRTGHGYFLTVCEGRAKIDTFQPTLDWLGQVLDQVPESLWSRWSTQES